MCAIIRKWISLPLTMLRIVRPGMMGWTFPLNLLRGLRAQMAHGTTHRAEKGKGMEEISVIGIDLAKNVFELCALSRSGEAVWTKRLKRLALIKFMEEEAPRCMIGMEACGGAHHWGRWLLARGFQVKLMAPSR